MRRNFILLFPLFLSLFCISSTAEGQRKFILDLEGGVGFSVGGEKTELVHVAEHVYEEIVTRGNYSNPLVDLKISVLENSSAFFVGLGAGLSISYHLEHPLYAHQVYSRVYVPVFIPFGYVFDLSEKNKLKVKARCGYSFTTERFHFTRNEFQVQIDGGINAGLSISFPLEFNSWRIAPKLGYDFQRFSNTYKSELYDRHDLTTPVNDVEFYTDFHTISVGLVLSY